MCQIIIKTNTRLSKKERKIKMDEINNSEYKHPVVKFVSKDNKDYQKTIDKFETIHPKGITMDLTN